MMNILNGGKHADSNVAFQEFMVLPVAFDSFAEALRAGTEVFHSLKSVLKKKGLNTGVGDEGGFAPNLESQDHAFDYIIEAIQKPGYEPRKQIFLGIDPAETQLFEKAKYVYNA